MHTTVVTSADATSHLSHPTGCRTVSAALTIFLVAILVIGSASPSAAETLLWATQLGGTSTSETAALGVALDSSGNSYVTGWTEGTLPGQTSAGGRDAFVAKYDSLGSEVWVRQFGSIGFDEASGIAVDSSGNSYVTGQAGGALSDPTSAGGGDAFVAKYDSDGNQQWVSQFDSGGFDEASGIAVDSSGNSYVTGRTNGVLGQASAGDADAFVAKYDADGNQLWVRQLGTSGFDAGNGVGVDSSGSSYVTGPTEGEFPTQSSAGGRDAFVAKYDSDGNQQWVRQLGTSGTDEASGIAVDSSGNSHAAGQAGGALPGHTAAGGGDAFVAKYDSDGTQQWVSQFGTNGFDDARGIAVDSWGNSHATGWTAGALPGQTATGGGDAFVVKYDSDGDQTWVGQFGTDGFDEGSGVAVDSSGSSYVAGLTLGTFPAQPPLGVIDAFVAKLDSNSAPEITSISAPEDPVAIDTAVNVSALFTDPDAGDTHACTIDWGDGSTPTAVDPATSPCSASHTYTATGIYTLDVTVTDDGGGSDSETFQYVVVYDPSAGFVTGGGWIASPAGAYTADPDLTGKASFGFVSRYKKGHTVPDGDTQFQFRAAGLAFESTDYEWLVIAGPKAQYKGSGTINGSGIYGFLLTATDGQQSGGGDVDRFRMKIWDQDDSDAIVYDNQVGDLDEGTATDAIEGGSIVIHTPKKR